MSDGPRDQESDGQAGANEPTTGPPAGAVSASSFDLDAAQGRNPGGGGTARQTGPRATTSPQPATTGPATTGPGASPKAATGPRPGPGSKTASKAATPPDAEARKRRKRRLLIAGISVAAALVVIALCAGGLAVLRAVTGFRDDAADAREDRRLRDSACVELETRLNRLVPPGATTGPQARAVAVRDENAATRIYVGRLGDQRVSDGWRELLDARTAFAEALDAQVKSRTPACFVAPAPPDGVSLADQLARWSPEACAGPIRRLAAPDL